MMVGLLHPMTLLYTHAITPMAKRGEELESKDYPEDWLRVIKQEEEKMRSQSLTDEQQFNQYATVTSSNIRSTIYNNATGIKPQCDISQHDILATLGVVKRKERPVASAPASAPVAKVSTTKPSNVPPVDTFYKKTRKIKAFDQTPATPQSPQSPAPQSPPPQTPSPPPQSPAPTRQKRGHEDAADSEAKRILKTLETGMREDGSRDVTFFDDLESAIEPGAMEAFEKDMTKSQRAAIADHAVELE
jgi:hypothetical protein